MVKLIIKSALIIYTKKKSKKKEYQLIIYITKGKVSKCK